MQESEINAQHILRLVVRDSREPKVLVNPPFEDMQDEAFPTYTDDPCNGHHWKFEYVWGVVAPYIFKRLGIPFNPADFRKIAGSESVYSRHLWRSDFKCSLYRFETNSIEDSTYNACCKGGGISKYHSVIRYPHESVLYTIDSPVSSDRSLLVNADSMAIPLVPLLLPYYRQVLFLDFRGSVTTRDLDIINKFDYTDYLCLFIARNYKHNAHLHNLTVGESVNAGHLTKSHKFTRRRSILAKLESLRKHR